MKSDRFFWDLIKEEFEEWDGGISFKDSNGNYFIKEGTLTTKQAWGILKDWWREIGKETFEIRYRKEENLKCECGFEEKVLKSDKEVTCPKCFRIYKKCRKDKLNATESK